MKFSVVMSSFQSAFEIKYDACISIIYNYNIRRNIKIVHSSTQCFPSIGLWALVNNAGIGGNGSFIEMCSKQDFVDALAVNLLGPIDVTKGFLPLVRRERGRVVCITSVMGRYPGVSAPYVVSKFGFEGYCDVLR